MTKKLIMVLVCLLGACSSNKPLPVVPKEAATPDKPIIGLELNDVDAGTLSPVVIEPPLTRPPSDLLGKPEVDHYACASLQRNPKRHCDPYCPSLSLPKVRHFDYAEVGSNLTKEIQRIDPEAQKPLQDVIIELQSVLENCPGFPTGESQLRPSIDFYWTADALASQLSATPCSFSGPPQCGQLPIKGIDGLEVALFEHNSSWRGTMMMIWRTKSAQGVVPLRTFKKSAQIQPFPFVDLRFERLPKNKMGWTHSFLFTDKYESTTRDHPDGSSYIEVENTEKNYFVFTLGESLIPAFSYTARHEMNLPAYDLEDPDDDAFFCTAKLIWDDGLPTLTSKSQEIPADILLTIQSEEDGARTELATTFKVSSLGECNSHLRRAKVLRANYDEANRQYELDCLHPVHPVPQACLNLADNIERCHLGLPSCSGNPIDSSTLADDLKWYRERAHSLTTEAK